MGFSLMVFERIVVFIGSVAIFTRELSSEMVVRYFDMSSAVGLIIELFSTLST